MTVDTQKQLSGLPQAPRLSEDRAAALIKEQRAQMAADNERRRKEMESPTFSIMLKRKGFIPAMRWALGQ
ncbi:hypothetical protein A7979_00765 [Rothia nasimurium]|uniref:Uncharacterized protein n=1 Tax=Rothia nasimurium TaxID=85336 RepID=A0A1Y1RRR6_9MICC|nr:MULTISPECIES: hypothetical protein [Rothia]ORC22081.1 hypothetical protein A7979_00765 [Rothia nasimurium]WHS51420.1 hypothetical protein QM007_05520 [Rothia sp. SD9660Na]